MRETSITNADLIYLTLTGKDPDKESCGKLENGVDFKCYSYKSDILTWLEDCRKEVAVYPIVRESITQYINLLKHLTNQTLNHNMEKELNQIIKSDLETAFTIANNLDSTLDVIFKAFFKQLKQFCDDSELICSNNYDLEKNYTGIWIRKPEWQYLNIGFQFQNYDKNLIFGFIAQKNPSQTKIPVEILNIVRGFSGNLSKTNKWWAWSDNMESPYDDWSKYHAWQAMTNGVLLSTIKENINMLVNSVTSIEI
jgi:hypothetical protein